MRLIHRTTALLLAAVAATAIACTSDHAPTVAAISTGTTVTVHNTSRFTMTNVKVNTGPSDSVVAASLAAGASTTAVDVTDIYETLPVRATVNGRDLALIPVEGFAQFNNKLVSGNYRVDLGVNDSTSDPAALTISVTKLP